VEDPSGFLERLGERKMIGSTFSASSDSKAEALRLEGEVSAVCVRFMMKGARDWVGVGRKYHSDGSSDS
jgi:hypothetical protein